MSKLPGPPLDLSWEWSAGREPARRVLIEVDSVEAAGGGLFGIQQSPSLAGALPDPVDLVGRVVAGPDELQGRELHLKLPRPELKEVAAGNRAGIGLVDDSVVICIVMAPAAVTPDAASEWLASFECSS